MRDVERKLIEYLPHVVREYAEFQGIMAGQQPEFELAWQAVEELTRDQFLMTAGAAGLSRWEKILQIKPRATDTLEERRFRVLSRLNEALPFTLPRLKELLRTLCGEGNFSAEIEAGTYELIVKVALVAKSNFHDVATLLERIAPQNLVVRLTQLYNSYAELAPFTHAQLAAYCHDDLRNEVFSNGKSDRTL